MLDKSQLAIDKLAPYIFDQEKDNRKETKEREVEKVEAKINGLLRDRQHVDPTIAMNLRSDATALLQVAEYAEKLADQMEQDKKEKKPEEVQKALLERLGIPAEFIDQLSILVKAGPGALREAAQVYRNEAQKKRDQADLVTMEIEKLDKQIKDLSHLKDHLSKQNGNEQVSMKEYLANIRYREALRDKSELILKQTLQQMEGLPTDI